MAGLSNLCAGWEGCLTTLQAQRIISQLCRLGGSSHDHAGCEGYLTALKKGSFPLSHTCDVMQTLNIAIDNSCELCTQRIDKAILM